jgi:hypothetical protein
MKVKAKNLRRYVSILCLVFLPLFAMAQAECTKVGGVTIEYGGAEFHYEYWCCSGPEGCFWDAYVV